MYTQFFGNFLLSKGYITNEQLFDALKEKAQKHAKLGTLAIHSGLMTAAEVDSVIVEQTHQDKKFGAYNRNGLSDRRAGKGALKHPKP